MAFAARHRLPAIYVLRDFVDTGGLMAYAPDLTIRYRRAADYVDKILKGAKPGDLPIEQPTKFEFVVNLRFPAACRGDGGDGGTYRMRGWQRRLFTRGVIARGRSTTTLYSR